jgi:hypothetical protein
MGRMDTGDCGCIEELLPAATSVLLPAGVSGSSGVGKIPRRAVSYVKDRDPARCCGQLCAKSDHFIVRMGGNNEQLSGS